MERQMVSSGRSLLSRPKGSSSSSPRASSRSEEHTSELQSRLHLVCRLLLEKKKTHTHDLLSLFPAFLASCRQPSIHGHITLNPSTLGNPIPPSCRHPSPLHCNTRHRAASSS